MKDRLVLAVPQDARPGVVWCAPYLNFSGYADEARAFTLGLRERGVDLRAEAIGDPNPKFVAGLSPETKSALDAATRAPRPKHAVHVLHVPGQTMQRLPGAGYHVARTMFETDGLPTSWVPRLNDMDEIWVPSAFNVATFRAAGVTAPMHVVPGGVHADQFVGAQPLPIEGLNTTVFLSVFEWSFRKGWDVLLRAWAKAFSPHDDVTLLLRCYPMSRPGVRIDQHDIERQINTFLTQLGTSRRRVAPIHVLHDHVADADMPRLYATADAYVSPTRGEGWGRPMLEAMAAGLPTIATRWSGNLEFMTDDNSLLIDVEKLEKVDQREELEFYRGQRWARPSVTHLTKLFQHVAADPSAARALGRHAQDEVARRWTWAAAVQAAAARLDDIDAHTRRAAPRPAAVPVRWVGEQYSWHSLAIANRELCARLVDNTALELELATGEHALRRPVQGDAVAALEARTGDVLSRPPRVEVSHQWPPDWNAPRQGAWVVMQPWEFGGLPDEWVKHVVAEVDEVWCYTTHVRDSYAASGVPEDRLRVIPLGVDTQHYTPDGDRYPLQTAKATKLLFVGGTIARKGIDVLLDAYCAAFGPDDDVCLVIKATGTDSVYRDNSEGARLAALRDDPGAPAIELITDDLSPSEMAALYRACDALVHPYRGEGFGLPVAEAMASGLPVIVTDKGATADFCDADTAYLIPSTIVPVPAGGLIPNTAGYWWAEPDPVTLQNLMRHVVASPDAARATGARARARVVAQLNWDTAAATMAERLTALAEVVPVRFRDQADPPTLGVFGPAVGDKHAQSQERRAPGGLISACMIVKDEAENLATCLAALDGIADEIVVYDTGSTDATVEIARRAGATVLEGEWADDFATARNAALAACTGTWVLWIDADEIIHGDKHDLRKVLQRNPHVDTISVSIDNLDGAGVAVAYSHQAARLFRRERGHWAGRLHERVVARPSQLPLKPGFTSDVRILHTGYRDEAIADKGKSERNIRLAEAELAGATDRRSEMLIHLGRSLSAAGRLDDALERFEAALAVTTDESERRLALRHGAEALLDTARPADALEWIERLRDAGTKAAMADYLEGIARAALGETDAAIDLLSGIDHVQDDDGFGIPDHVLHLRLAFVYRNAQRWDDATDELLAMSATGIAPPWGLLTEVTWRAGRNPDEVASEISSLQLTYALGQLLAIEPAAADGVLDALFVRWPHDAAVFACVIELAPRLGLDRALEWSARLRQAGFAEGCPLVTIAADDARAPLDRVQAMGLLSGAFGDDRADLVASVASAVAESDIVTALIQLNELAPQLLPQFVLAASLGRAQAMADALRQLGATEQADAVLELA